MVITEPQQHVVHAQQRPYGFMLSLSQVWQNLETQRKALLAGWVCKFKTLQIQ